MQVDNTPFFIIGAPRSGTTLLRDILRSHERLASPEETFYFRWSFPLGSLEYRNTYINNPTIRKHREIDGLDEDLFLAKLDSCSSRKELMDYHGEFVAKKSGKPRWFDKTPQNVYGALLMASYYPDSKFLCVWRNPLNVVASLIEGRQLKAHSIEGAINYWLEAALVILEFSRLHKSKLITLHYESLTTNPPETTSRILHTLGEDPALVLYQWDEIHEERNLYESALSYDQIDQVIKATVDTRIQIGY